MKKALFLVARILVTAALVLFVATRVNFRDRTVSGTIIEHTPSHIMLRSGDGRHMILREEVVLPPGASYDALKPGSAAAGTESGFFTILKTLRMRHYLVGLAFIGAIFCVAAARWLLLLKVQGVHLSYREGLKLTFIGLFFNNISVGLTGGDVVKAYLVSRMTDRKAQAVSTVFLDRIVGLVAMLVMAGLAALALVGHGEVRRVAVYIYGCLGIAAAGTAVYYSRRLRRLFRVDAVLARLPFKRVVRRVDEALFLYRSHKRALGAAFLLSLVCHTMAVGANIFFGRALGITGAAPYHYFMFIPTIIFISALPIALCGWGLRETSFQYFFGLVGVPATRAITLSIVYALSQVLWSLVGGIVFASSKTRTRAQEMERIVEEAASD